ncbi:MAG: hypothetical protein KKE02_10435 [Alphaproteobacteria bacterium]|nr:hypothetical protein [Alphaproteobacteria bacterium]MBU2094073.1 hypothetical protein [Alphaproteobacteria bacterium]MBU2151425.1 hypothetical protein [Alphaproteobacteria bacterium]MBU2365145.1 hypothetical protein [Alphaproteobacteria bacterium]
MPSREEEMLARLAELDLAAAEKTHGKLMAAEDTAEISDLGRAYQRLSRSLRQTLALKARLARERQVAAANAPPPTWPHTELKRLRPPVRAHVDKVHEAVMRFVEREVERGDYEDHEIEAYEVVLERARDDGFTETPVADLVIEALETMALIEPADDEAEADDAPGLETEGLGPPRQSSA